MGFGLLTVHADLTTFTDSSLNDMVVDEQEGAWVGCFGFDLMALADPQLAPLMRVDPAGTVTVVAEYLVFPNGSVITPDGRTLLLCAAPDFLETNRRPARDAVLFTATVEVGHAGRP